MPRGGYRPGAGRPKGSKSRTKITTPAGILTPLDFMLAVMRDPDADLEMRARMAVAAAPYVHARVGEKKGKKEEKQERAKAAGSGKFAPSRPPSLKVVKR